MMGDSKEESPIEKEGSLNDNQKGDAQDLDQPELIGQT